MAEIVNLSVLSPGSETIRKVLVHLEPVCNASSSPRETMTPEMFEISDLLNIVFLYREIQHDLLAIVIHQCFTFE